MDEWSGVRAGPVGLVGRVGLSDALANQLCLSIQLVARRQLSVTLRKTQTEAVAFEPWDDVHVHVKNLLSGLFAIGEKQIDPFDPQPGLTQRAGKAMGDRKHGGARVSREIRQIRCVLNRNHEEMAGRHWTNV